MPYANPEKRKEYAAAYRKANAKKARAYAKDWRKAHPIYLTEYNKEYTANNKETLKQYQKERHIKRYEKEKENIKHRNRQWNKQNREYLRINALQRRKTNIQYKLACYLRARLRSILKGKRKAGSAVNNLGCTLTQLKDHLEKQFTQQMTWGNYGKVWHIDHIEPLCSFDLTIREQLLIACHYTNLRPLDAIQNMSEGGKLAKSSRKNNESIYTDKEVFDLSFLFV